MGWDGMGWGGTGRDRLRWDRIGWDRMERTSPSTPVWRKTAGLMRRHLSSSCDSSVSPKDSSMNLAERGDDISSACEIDEITCRGSGSSSAEPARRPVRSPPPPSPGRPVSCGSPRAVCCIMRSRPSPSICCSSSFFCVISDRNCFFFGALAREVTLPRSSRETGSACAAFVPNRLRSFLLTSPAPPPPPPPRPLTAADSLGAVVCLTPASPANPPAFCMRSLR